MIIKLFSYVVLWQSALWQISSALAERKTSVEEINQIFIEESASERYHDIVGVTHDPVVSSDIIKDPRVLVIDLGMTRVVDGGWIKILS